MDTWAALSFRVALVPHLSVAMSVAHFIRVDTPPAQPSQPTIPQLFTPPAAKKQKQDVVVIDLTDN